MNFLMKRGVCSRSLRAVVIWWNPPSQVSDVESENTCGWEVGSGGEWRGRRIFAEVLQHRLQLSFSSPPGDVVSQQIIFLLKSVRLCCLKIMALTETIIKIRTRPRISAPHSDDGVLEYR